jgi:NAD(P)-dependent dehydrogenase (short-subunit alcohol dehydrogenase family)
MSNFEGKVAVITGAASGLGHIIAVKLLEEGAFAALIDLNGEVMQSLFGRYGDRAASYAVDITHENQVNETVENILSRFGKIDILVNCAGITGLTNIQSHLVDPQNLRKVFDINYMGSFFTSKAVLPGMLNNGYGRILHIASIAGKEGNAGMLAYSSSKAAVIGMTKVQGKEYAGTGITVNAMAPAVIQTALVDAMPEEQVKYMTDKIPMKRCGTLEEAADLACYIVSEKNSFTTGFTFDLSGGRATY